MMNWRVVLASVRVGAVCAGAMGQHQAPGSPTLQMGGAPSEPTEPVVSVDFKGGTVGDYVEALRHASEQPVNVTLPPTLARLAMPPVKLKSVSLGDALSAIVAVAETPANERLYVAPLSNVGNRPVGNPVAGAVTGYAVM